MPVQVLIAHAEGEEDQAELLAVPLREAGFIVAHRGTVMIGESITEDASKVLSTGGPVVLCGTVKAMGTGWAFRLINAARLNNPDIRVFPVQMERDAYLQQLSLDATIARFWQDPSKAVQDLIASLNKYFPASPDDIEKTAHKERESYFDAPRFGDNVIRKSLLSELDHLFGGNSIVAVEGLPGSGKTYLVTSYLENYQQQTRTDKTIWYETQKGETLDDFLTQIGSQIELSTLSPVLRCKEVLNHLSKRGICLVVDDFHQVDQASYSTLINIAAGYRKPLNLVLISRTYVDLLRNLPRIGHLEVRGFTLEEMRKFLKSRGLSEISALTLTNLIEKTDGLPLAASLFALLVLDFGRHPRDLLNDSMQSTVRLRMWFNDVLSIIGEPDSSLLRRLSVCEGPFNFGVVRRLYESIGISDPNQAFEKLQRCYLVQKYSHYRWNIHQLISMFCQSTMSSDEKDEVHLALAKHYMTGFHTGGGPRILSDREFHQKTKACRQFQLANEHTKSQRILQNIIKTAKARGYYDAYIQLSAAELKDNSRNNWIDYDHAHCCLITGRLKQSLEVIEPLIYSTKESDANKRVAFTRLYAETINSMGKPELALRELRQVLNATDHKTINPNILSHAQSSEIWLLIQLKNYEEASTRSEMLLADAKDRDDKIAIAVALTLSGIISQMMNSHRQARAKLENAMSTFSQAQDLRGVSWAKSYLAVSKLETGDWRGGIDLLREALKTRCNIGECSIDYFDFLQSLHERLSGTGISRVINAEINRVSSILGNEIS